MARAINSIARNEMKEQTDEITWKYVEKGQVTNKSNKCLNHILQVEGKNLKPHLEEISHIYSLQLSLALATLSLSLSPHTYTHICTCTPTYTYMQI